MPFRTLLRSILIALCILPLASAWAHTRTIRLADGPDEVHREAIAKLELKDARSG